MGKCVLFIFLFCIFEGTSGYCIGERLRRLRLCGVFHQSEMTYSWLCRHNKAGSLCVKEIENETKLNLII